MSTAWPLGARLETSLATGVRNWQSEIAIEFRAQSQRQEFHFSPGSPRLVGPAFGGGVVVHSRALASILAGVGFPCLGLRRRGLFVLLFLQTQSAIARTASAEEGEEDRAKIHHHVLANAGGDFHCAGGMRSPLWLVARVSRPRAGVA